MLLAYLILNTLRANMILYEFRIKITRQDSTTFVLTERVSVKECSSDKFNAAFLIGRRFPQKNYVSVEILTCRVVIEEKKDEVLHN